MTLQELLLQHCQQLNVEPEHLATPSAQTAPMRALLLDATRLRQRGQADRALELLSIPASVGIQNSWIDDGRARCLLILGCRTEARGIWTELLSEDDNALRAHAAEMLHQMELEASFSTVLKQMEELAAVHGWSLRGDFASKTSYAAFQHALLEEAIASRESSKPEFSLLLMELSLRSGFNTPWLLDNKARALVQLERLAEACEAWELMGANTGDDDVQRIAGQMLSLYKPRRDAMVKGAMVKAQVTHAMELADSGDREAAMDSLVQALLLNPSAQACESALMELLDQRRQEQDKNWGDFSELLHQQELNLEVSELLIRAVETKLGSCRARPR